VVKNITCIHIILLYGFSRFSVTYSTENWEYMIARIYIYINFKRNIVHNNCDGRYSKYARIATGHRVQLNTSARTKNNCCKSFEMKRSCIDAKNSHFSTLILLCNIRFNDHLIIIIGVCFKSNVFRIA